MYMEREAAACRAMDEALPGQQGSVDAAIDGEAWWSSDTVQAQRQRYALTIEYIGTDYHGSQRQVAGAGEGVGNSLTVQDDLEQALRKLVPHAPRAPVAIFSGRTDAGVHATGSVVHVDLVRCDRNRQILPPFTEETLLRSLSHALPKRRLGIVSAQRVPLSFHAQRSARMRTYIYRIKCLDAGRRDDHTVQGAVHRTDCCHGLWQYGWVSAHDEHRALCLQEAVNVEAMREAASVLIGRHDFSAFRGSRCTAGSPILTLDALDVIVEHPDTLDAMRHERGVQTISVRVRAHSFLRKQVRYLVAALLEAGCGRLEAPAEGVRCILSSGNTGWAKPVAPHGLYLACVEYPVEAFLRPDS